MSHQLPPVDHMVPSGRTAANGFSFSPDHFTASSLHHSRQTLTARLRTRDMEDEELFEEEDGDGMLATAWTLLRHFPYFVRTCLSLLWEIFSGVLGIPIVTPEYRALERQLEQCSTYAEWRAVGSMLDDIDHYQTWRTEERSPYLYFDGVVRCLQELAELKRMGDTKGLLEALRSRVHRSLYGINNPQLYRYRTGTKDVIHSYTSLVCYLIRSLAEEDPLVSPQVRYQTLSQIAGVYGATALVLNGGMIAGPLHLGVAKALYEANLLPQVIYGSRSGAMIAALLCCVPDTVSVLDESRINFSSFAARAGRGTAKRRWRRLLSRGHLMDADVLLRFAKDNLGELTFRDAYQLTGRILNIQFTSFYPDETGHIQRCSCLLNYLTTPDVLVYTAAVASVTSVPFMYGRVPLLARDLSGRVVPYDPVVLLRSYPQWRVDREGGLASNSLHRLRELLNIQYFIVSECATLRLPLLFNPDVERHSFLVRVFRYLLEQAMRLLLRFLRMTPLESYVATSFDNDVERGAASTGDVMIIYPATSFWDLYRLWEPFSRSQRQQCLAKGERQVWPRLEEIRMCRAIEQTLSSTQEALLAQYPKLITAERRPV